MNVLRTTWKVIRRVVVVLIIAFVLATVVQQITGRILVQAGHGLGGKGNIGLLLSLLGLFGGSGTIIYTAALFPNREVRVGLVIFGIVLLLAWELAYPLTYLAHPSLADRRIFLSTVAGALAGLFYLFTRRMCRKMAKGENG